MTLLGGKIKRIWPYKLKYRFILSLVLIHLLLMVIFVVRIEREESRHVYIEDHSEASIIANSVAVNAAYRILANDAKGLQEIVTSLQGFPGLQYVMIISVDHVILADSRADMLGKKNPDSLNKLSNYSNQQLELSEDSAIHDIVSPIVSPDKQVIGWVRIVEQDKNVYSEIISISRTGIIYIVVVLVVVFLIALFIANVLTNGIQKLLYVVKEIRLGKHDIRATASNIFEINTLGTAINKMLDEIEEKRAQLNAINDNLPDSIVYQTKIGDDGISHYQYLSKGIEKYAGKSVSELINDPYAFIEMVHPDDKEKYFERRNTSIVNSSDFNIEIRIITYLGETRWMNISAIPRTLEDKSIVWDGIFTDVTNKKAAVEAVKVTAQSYFDLFNTITEAIYIQDENGVFIDVNYGVEKMYGYQREEVIGKTPEFLSASGKNDLPLIFEIVTKTFTTGIPEQFEFWGQRKNGEIFPKDVICNKGRYFGKDVIITTARDITERKLVEDELRESEEKFSKIFHLSPDVIMISRITDGVIVDVNERAFSLSGYTREEALGMTTFQLNGWANEDERKRFVSMLMNEGRVSNFEKKLTIRSGQVIDTTISGELIELKGVKYILTVIHDITDRIKAEQEIKERVIQLQMLGDNLPDTMMFQLVRELNGDLKFSYLSKEVENITGKTVEEVLQNPNILFDLINREDQELLSAAQNVSFKEMTPLSAEIRKYSIKGEIIWYAINSVPRRLSDGRVIWDGVQTDITNKKISEIKIKESEEKYRSLISQATDAIVIYSLDGTIYEFNKSAYAKTGYTFEEFSMLTINDLLTNDEFLIDHSVLKKMKAGEIFWFTRKLKSKDGTLMDAEFNARLLDDNRILAFVRDITDRKDAERKIKEISERYQQLFEKTPIPVWVCEIATLDIIDVNEAAILHYGYTRAEFLNMKITNISPESDVDKIVHLFKQQQEDFSHSGVWKHMKKDGTVIDVEVTSHDFDYNDKKCRIVLLNDITEKLEAEKRLAESEIKYRTMIEHNQAGIYQTTLKGNIVSCNNAFVKMLGYESKEEVLAGNASMFYFFDAHREEFIELLQLNRELNNFELELKNKNGKPVYMIGNCFIRKDLVSGEDIIEGTLIDISKRKLAEEALLNSLKEVSDYQYALDQSAIISITDQHGILKHVNDNFCALYGFTKEEVIGETHGRLINSGYHPKAFWEKFWKHIKTGKVLKVEVCNKSKDGSLHWGDTTIVPFLNEEGKPYQYLAIRSDVTEKRKLEKALIEQQIQQQKLIIEMTIAAQEKERNELGKELHDNINQILATVKMYLGMAKIKTIGKNGLDLVAQSYDYVNEVMEEIRKLSHSLVAPSLGDIGLYEALEELIQEVSMEKNIQFTLKYEIDTSQMIDNKEELMFYRIVQEQVNNIRKYSNAKNVIIQLCIKGDNQELTITDDGVGFDTAAKNRGIGLKNIQSRVEFYSGTMNVVSSPGKGCTLNISIPLKSRL
ncbi:MAG: PAS domain S-box protein [Ferruginibacter sp.]